jgi:hypothetical protein
MAKSKSASSKSKIDFQKILLEKGEKIGLIVAGVGFLLLALFGVMAAAGAANPSRLTNEIKSGIASIDNRLQSTPEVHPPEVEVPDNKSVFVHVKPTDFQTRNDLFDSSGAISEKRTNPTILGLIEGRATYQIGGIGVVTILNNRVEVIKDRQAPARNNLQGVIKRAKDKNKGAAPNPILPQPPPPPGPPGFGGGKNAPKGNVGAGAGKSSEAEIDTVDIDSPEFETAYFAVNLRPVRMARIQGIVPYKLQVEKHMRALRLDSDAALTSDHSEPIYRGFNVQRQILSADGKKVIQDWTAYDPVEARRKFQEPALGSKQLFAAYEPVDEKLKPFIPDPVHQLFMKAPKLVHGAYDVVQLNELGRAMQEIEKAEPKDLTDRGKKAAGKDNPFDETDLVAPGQVGGKAGPSISGGNPNAPPAKGGPAGGRGGVPRGGVPGYQGGGTSRTSAAPVWLLQFIDPTIEPGYCYKYRIQLKAENPNYDKRDLVAFPGLAKEKELVSDWFEIPDVVYAQPEEYLYAHGEKHKDRQLYGTPDYDTTTVKYHRWFDYVRVTREGGISDPIGEWVVADISAKRGQYIQERDKLFRLPLWSMVIQAYAFRDPISKVGTTKNQRLGENVHMDFSPMTPVLLVDFDGGAGTYRGPKGMLIKDESNGEILIITDDGKTLKVSAQNTATDKGDAQRKAREDAWDKWLEEVKNGGDRPANAPGGLPKAGG